MRKQRRTPLHSLKFVLGLFRVLNLARNLFTLIGCVLRSSVMAMMPISGAIVWYIGSVNQTVATGSKVVCLSNFVVFRSFIYSDVILLKLMADCRCPLDRLSIMKTVVVEVSTHDAQSIASAHSA